MFQLDQKSTLSFPRLTVVCIIAAYCKKKLCLCQHEGQGDKSRLGFGLQLT